MGYKILNDFESSIKMENIEKNLKFLAITAIEDKL